MVIAWISYCLLVSAFLALAAFAAERALGHYRRPVRWVWAGALVGSLVIPIVGYVAPTLVARFRPVAEALPVVLPVTSLPELAVSQAGAESFWSGLWAFLGPALGAIWIASVIGFGAYLVTVQRRLRREMVEWTPGQVLDTSVMMSRDRGPAVVGLGRGVIVLPEWISELEEDVLRLVFLHEREHQRAGDNRLFTVGLASLAAMPWNPIAWWQLRRLRLAIEFDCDSRVIAHGVDARQYAEALLTVGTRLTTPPLASFSFAERRPAIERRLRRMTEPLRKLRGPRAAVAAVAGSLAVALACGSPAPTNVDDGEFTVTAIDTDGGAGPHYIPHDTPARLENQQQTTEALSDLYPPDLKAAGIGGRAEAWIFVSEEGLVTSSEIKTSSGNPSLDDATLELVAQMEFVPAENEGVPTGIWMSQWVTFQAEDEAAETTVAPAPDPLIVVDGVIQSQSTRLDDLQELEIDHVEVIKGEAAEEMFGDRGQNGVVNITTKEGAAGKVAPRVDVPPESDAGRLKLDIDQIVGRGTVSEVPGQPDRVIVRPSTGGDDAPDPLMVVDGVIMSGGFDLSRDEIDHVEVIKGAAALEQYGDRARNGVIVVTTKKDGEMTAQGESPKTRPDVDLTADQVERLRQASQKLAPEGSQEASTAEPYDPPPRPDELQNDWNRPAFVPYDRPPTIVNGEELMVALQTSYPTHLKDAGIGGRVEVWVYVDEAGVVTNHSIRTSSGNDELDAAAAAVMQQARFNPAVNRDQPTAVWLAQWVTFGVT